MNFTGGLSFWESFLVYFLLVWSLFWRGLSMWKASQTKQKNWFIALLLLNTLGIVDILFLFRFAKKKMKTVEIKDGFKKLFYTEEK